jgi:hypothetical protein
MKQPPAIIIGAGRSGTNMLRDVLVQIPGFGTWPCDEINYIWRHGNRGYATDEFTRAMATPSVKKFIRSKFEQLSTSFNLSTVVEKTCANSLRCGFVAEVLPEARFVHIVRDGRDVAVSAAQRWKAPLDIGYIAKKAKYVPIGDLPYYATKYLGNRIYRLTRGGKRLSTWGPKFTGMQEALANHSLPVACAVQWQACVSRTLADLAEIPASQHFTLTYESFTNAPQKTVLEIAEFLKVDMSPEQAKRYTSAVSDRSIGNWKKKLSAEDMSAVQDLTGALLSQLGYDVGAASHA